MSQTDVLVLGGGVIGLATAYYLQDEGRSVRVIDTGPVGEGASHGNLGLVSPSHAGPLAVPGMIGKAFKWSFDPKSPFYARPTLSPARIKWFLDFAKRCNMRDFDRSAAGRAALLMSARTLYDAFFEKHQVECEWQPVGMLMVYKTQKALDQAIPLEEHLKQFGVVSEVLSRQELLEKEPALREDVAGAHYFPQDGHLRPDLLVKEMARVVTERGGVIEADCETAVFREFGGKVQGVTTSNGSYGAKDYVVATGAWTPKVVGPLGLKIPIQPGKGYSITTERPANCPRHACILKERNMAVTPWPSGLRLGGTMEFTGYEDSLNDTRLEAICEGASEYFKESFVGVEGERWSGWRPMTTDGMPLIGRSRISNLLVAAGHGMLGVSQATSTGKLVAALVSGTEPPVDPFPYRLERF